MNDPILPGSKSSYTTDFVHDGIIELKTIIGQENNRKELTIGIQGFTKEQQKWLAEVIPSQIQRAYEHGFTEARHQVRKKFTEALGIKQ